MSKKKDYPDNVIPFPREKRSVSEDDIRQLEISHQAVQDLVILAACVNMTTSYKGKFDEDCREKVMSKEFPCSADCGCYTHMLSSMALELVFEGPRSDEAREQLYNEYARLIGMTQDGAID